MNFTRWPVLLALGIMSTVPGMAKAAEATQQPCRGLLLVANKGDRTLGIIDPESGRLVAAVAEDGVTGHEVAASPDGRRAFVPIYGNSGVGHPGTDGQHIRVIDLERNQISATIDLGKGLRPHCAVFGPKNGLLYVTTELGQCITVIDPRSLQVIDSIPTGQPESHMLAITRDGRRGYTSNVGVGTVSVLDLEAKKVLSVIPVCEVAQRIALSMDGRWAFTADQGKPRLAVIDTDLNKVSRWISLPGIAYGTAPTPDGHWLILALIASKKVGVVDLQTMTFTRAIEVPPAPQEVLVQPDGAKAYVSCDKSQQIAVVDLKNWKLEKMLEAGAGADGLAWAPRR